MTGCRSSGEEHASRTATTATEARADVVPEPASLVLQLADLPAGFALKRRESGPLSNAKAARLTQDDPDYAEKLEKWGRVGGYEATYEKEASLRSAFRGALSITSRASTYRTEAGAADSFEDGLRSALEHFKELSPGSTLGDESHLLSYASKSKNGFEAQVYVLIWRHDRVLSTILMAGLKGITGPDEIIELGKKQEARIRDALAK